MEGSQNTDLRRLSLEIEGMTCMRCGEAVQRGLMQVKGVAEAVVDWKTGSADVIYHAKLVSANDIVLAPVFSQERVIENDSRVVRHRYTASCVAIERDGVEAR